MKLPAVHLQTLTSNPSQVAVSFPGADFDKGAEGHLSDLMDHTGKVLASSGTEMAEALRQWLVQGWLGGDETLGETLTPEIHVDLCVPMSFSMKSSLIGAVID